MTPLDSSTTNIFVRYVWNILISIDQLFNTLFFGSPDETISSRMGKWLLLPKASWKWKIAYGLCRCLHWIDNGHCAKSIETDEGHNDIL